MEYVESFIKWITTSNLPLYVIGIIFYLRNKKEIIASFYNNGEGFSARKLTAFASVVMAIKLSLIHTNTTNFEIVLYSWMAFYSLNAGLITFQQFIEFKNGKKEGNKEEEVK